MNNISLSYFITVAEEENISNAARKLFITQQSLSEHIKKLEKSYNAVFFERTPRLKLTYQGERMLAYAHKVIEAERMLNESLRQDSQFERVRLTIGEASVRGSVFMPSIFKRYHQLYPNVALSIFSGNYEYIENLLQRGKIEMYMGMSVNSNLRSSGETLYRDKLFFIISTELLHRVLGDGADEFIARHSTGVSIKDACRFPIAIPPVTSTLRLVFEKIFTQNGISPSPVLETTDHDILFDVCHSGICGCFVSRELLYRKIMHKSRPANILYFPASEFTELSYFNIIYGRSELSSYAAAFVKCCRETIGAAINDIDLYLSSRDNRL